VSDFGSVAAGGPPSDRCVAVAQAAIPAVVDGVGLLVATAIAGAEAGATLGPASLGVAQASLPAILDFASSPSFAEIAGAEAGHSLDVSRVPAGLLGGRFFSPVYVDRLRVFPSRQETARREGERFGHRWCHLWSDDIEALHAMAGRLGMKREWFHDRPGFPHYDLPPFRREAALAFGAVENSLKAWLRQRRERSVRATPAR
jgi:hypothetical protein